MSANSIDFSEYSELVGEGGYNVKTPTLPENEFFHAVYISGQQRKNHLGEVEMPGKLQIRGLRSNLDEIHMIIVNIKNVLVKTIRTDNGRDNLECFSYQAGDYPWKGTSGNTCGKNSTERAAIPFCSACRSQLIITGIYLDNETGKPFLVDGKPSYVFIRAKGTKYGNVADYLANLARRDDLEPMVTPVTEQSKEFEKAHVNHKRFVTVVTTGKQSTNYGLKDVFELTTGSSLSPDTVKNVLNKSKETMEKFKEKFDWSRGKNSGSADYTEKVDDAQQFQFSSGQTQSGEAPVTPEKTEENYDVSFEDVPF